MNLDGEGDTSRQGFAGDHFRSIAGTERFGPYELLRPLGSGGMGTVWLARQDQDGVERLVALKMVRAAALFSRDARERFRREARAMFRVEHPGICPIHDVGEVDGTPYLAMRYVPGRTLHGILATSCASGSGPPFGVGEALTLLERIARALHAAHETGLVHRDVKPGNVMVTPQGEPVLLDFGLARASGEASDLTLSGAPLGTPAYMSPEQIAGRPAAIDRRSDVWSLAVTAYECLTLATPFRAETRESLYRRILEETHAPARHLIPSLPRELDVVLAMALAKDPARRYPTALAFAEDLAAVRTMRPTRARRATVVERTRLWARRNRAVSALLVLLSLALGASLVSAVAARRRTDEAERSRRVADDSYRAARDAMAEVSRVAMDELASVPGSGRPRQRMLAAAVAFHERFVALRETDQELAADVVAAWTSIGELELELGGLAAAERALAAAASRSPGDHAITRLRGEVAVGLGRVDDGIALLREAIAAADARLAADPADSEARWSRSLAAAEIVDALEARGETSAAFELCEAALAAFDQGLDAADAAWRVRRARLVGRLALLEWRLQRVDEAERRFTEGIPVLEGSWQDGVADRDELSLLVVLLDGRAELLQRTDRVAEAIADRRNAVAVCERLVALRPDDHRHAATLAGVCANLGDALVEVAAFGEARRFVERGRALYLAIVAGHPEVEDAARQAMTAAAMLGEIGLREGDADAALRDFHLVVDEVARAPDLLVARIDAQRTAVRAHDAIGRIHAANGRVAEAQASFAAAAAVLHEALDAAPDDHRLVTDDANLASRRAMLAAATGDTNAAADWFARSSASWRSLVPGDVNAPRALALAVHGAAWSAWMRSATDVNAARLAAGEALAWSAAAPADALAAADELALFHADRAALELLCAADAATRARIAAELDALEVELAPEWLLALRALAHLHDDAAVAQCLVELGAHDEPFDDSFAPVSALVRVLLGRFEAGHARDAGGFDAALAAIRGRLAKRGSGP